MKTNKFSKFAVTAAVLFITTLLVTNCLEPINGLADLGTNDGGVLRPESYVVLSINSNSAAKTIMPTPLTFNGADMTYDLKITAQGGADSSKDVNSAGITYAQLTASKQLTATASYEFEVKAYRTVSSVPYLVGKWTETKLINTGLNTIAVELVPIKTGTDAKGFLSWNFTLPTGFNASTGTAEFGVYANKSATANILNSGTNYDLKTSLTGNGQLDPGQYWVRVKITTTNFKDLVVEESVHIYQGMTSSWSPDLGSLSSMLYNVTLNYNNGVTPHTTANGTVLHHTGRITEPSKDIPVEVTNMSGKTIESWTKDAAGLETITWATEPWYGPVTLYAKWIEIDYIQISVSMSIDGDDGIELTIDNASFTKTQVQNGSAAITISGNPAGINLAAVEWRYDSSLVTTGSTLTFSQAVNSFFSVVGQHRLTLWFETAKGTQSKDILITVTES